MDKLCVSFDKIALIVLLIVVFFRMDGVVELLS